MSKWEIGSETIVTQFGRQGEEMAIEIRNHGLSLEVHIPDMGKVRIVAWEDNQVAVSVTQIGEAGEVPHAPIVLR
jgi:hypothetical protein